MTHDRQPGRDPEPRDRAPSSRSWTLELIVALVGLLIGLAVVLVVLS